MPAYIDSFDVEDQQRLLRLLALFSKCESAIKRHWARAGAHGQADADWPAFADVIAQALNALTDPRFVQAKTYLLQHPPKRQELQNNQLTWAPNPRRANETDARYLLRIAKDVRNNLFHGGKYQGGPEPEIARDRECIDSATTILEAAIVLDARSRAAFEEPV